MRSSDDLERVLSAWRPSGPPPELRARIIGARGFSRAVAEWLPAVAALLLVVLFHWLGANERQRIESRVLPVAPVDYAAAVLAEPQE